ncbi:MAG: hypothetical protein WBM24_09635 [Candidatus Sulfotelmatobacter sp.]
MDETIQKLDLEIAKRVSYLPAVLKAQFSWTDLQTSEQEGIAHAIEVTKKLPALLDDSDPNAMKLLKPYGDEDSPWCLTPEAKSTLQTQVLPAFQLDRWKY